MKKLSSLSIFFPFFNDENTVDLQINDAYKYGNQITNNLEVIAIHGGRSEDKTFKKILKQKKLHPDLKILDKSDNFEGYAVIKYGFKAATKDWIFYSDGDAQYHLDELSKLVRKQSETDADIVNGCKIKRHDGLTRKIIGYVYNKLNHIIYPLPISDLDCDYRLIRKSFLKKIKLKSASGVICLELILKLRNAGASFAEVKVKHYPRIYGKSEFFNINHITKSLWENIVFFRQKH